MIQKLKEKINFKINSIQFVKREGLTFLDIEIPETSLDQIEEKSKIILNLIHEIDDDNIDYYLNVYSEGTEKEIDLNNINLFIDQYLLVKTNKHYLHKVEWEGHLIENNINDIVIKINNKGRIQKLKINKKDISFIKTTAKLRKEK